MSFENLRFLTKKLYSLSVDLCFTLGVFFLFMISAQQFLNETFSMINLQLQFNVLKDFKSTTYLLSFGFIYFTYQVGSYYIFDGKSIGRNLFNLTQSKQLTLKTSLTIGLVHLTYFFSMGILGLLYFAFKKETMTDYTIKNDPSQTHLAEIIFLPAPAQAPIPKEKDREAA